jgi:hypothetical protein
MVAAATERVHRTPRGSRLSFDCCVRPCVLATPCLGDAAFWRLRVLAALRFGDTAYWRRCVSLLRKWRAP